MKVEHTFKMTRFGGELDGLDFKVFIEIENGITEAQAFDGNGNYSLSLSEQLVFPELNPDKYTKPQGMNITICTTARTNDEALLLLEMFGMPFKAAKTPAA